MNPQVLLINQRPQRHTQTGTRVRTCALPLSMFRAFPLRPGDVTKRADKPPVVIGLSDLCLTVNVSCWRKVKIRTHAGPRSLLLLYLYVHSYHAAKPTPVPPNRLALVHTVLHVLRKSAAADHIQPNVGPASGLPRMRSGS